MKQKTKNCYVLTQLKENNKLNHTSLSMACASPQQKATKIKYRNILKSISII